MKLYYVYNGELKGALIGVKRKIDGQKKAFETYGYKVKIINISNSLSKFGRWINLINPFADHYGIRRIYESNDNSSVYYFRMTMFDWFVFRTFKTLKTKKNIIVVEIPTYPFVKELNYISGKILYIYHRLYLYACRQYVDFFVTYSKHKSIYGVSSIPISNGIDTQLYSLSKHRWNAGEPLNILVVAKLAKWHGVDRVINGLKKYYSCSGVNQDVFLYIVGEGDVLCALKELVYKSGLEKNVKFCGLKLENDLDEIYNISHIGIASLGCHRKDIYSASELKTREYLARGLPFISSVFTPDIPEDFKYIKYFPSDDSSIDIEKVVDWATELYMSSSIEESIREWAVLNLSWEVKLKPVVEKLKLVRND